MLPNLRFLAIIPTAMPSAPQSPLTGLTAVMPQTGQADTQPQQYQLYDQSQLQFAQSKYQNRRRPSSTPRRMGSYLSPTHLPK